MIDYKMIYNKLIERQNIYTELRSTPITLDTSLDEFIERKKLIAQARRLENEIYTYDNIMQGLNDIKDSKTSHIIFEDNERLDILTYGKSSPNYCNFTFRALNMLKDLESEPI
jgi:hypothetical protein